MITYTFAVFPRNLKKAMTMQCLHYIELIKILLGDKGEFVKHGMSLKATKSKSWKS